MILHCDECRKPLGEYLYGKGGVAEKAVVKGGTGISLPDIVCYECCNKVFAPKLKIVKKSP